MDLYTFQLSLYPLGTASILFRDVSMTLFTTSKLFPDFICIYPPLLTTLLVAYHTLPNLSSTVSTVLL